MTMIMAEPRVVKGFAPSDPELIASLSSESDGSSTFKSASPLTQALRDHAAHFKPIKQIRAHRRASSCVETLRHDPEDSNTSEHSPSSCTSAIPIPESRRSNASCQSNFVPGSWLSMPAAMPCFPLTPRQSSPSPKCDNTGDNSLEDDLMDWDEDMFEMELPCSGFVHVPGLQIRTGRPKSLLANSSLRHR